MDTVTVITKFSCVSKTWSDCWYKLSYCKCIDLHAVACMIVIASYVCNNNNQRFDSAACYHQLHTKYSLSGTSFIINSLHVISVSTRRI